MESDRFARIALRLLCLGTFSGFAIFLPELFPAHMRSTAVGFTTGTARFVTGFGTLVAVLMVGAFGGKVTAEMTYLAILSILAMAIAHETKRTELPR